MLRFLMIEITLLSKLPNPWWHSIIVQFFFFRILSVKAQRNLYKSWKGWKTISNFWKLRANKNPRYIRWNLSEPKLPLDVRWLIWINSKWNTRPVSEFNEFKPSLKSPKNRFQLSTGLNLEKLNTIFSGTNNIYD